MDKLIEKINRMQNPTVIGLDTAVSFIPETIKKKAMAEFGNTTKAVANAILNFNKKIIDEICNIVPAAKLQCAYYELYGHNGIWALEQTLNYCKQKNMFTIVDGKKNDIGPSMQAYSNAYLGESKLLDGTKFQPFNCDALTVNPYLGSDGIEPIAENCFKLKKNAFVLVKTSNPGSGELQNLKTNENKLVFEYAADICEKFSDFQYSKNGFNSIGAVVGATHPLELKKLRLKLPKTFFLVPGFGAQGADLQNLKFAFNENRIGAIVNSSRSLIGAWLNSNCSELDFAKETKRAAIKMKNDIQKILHKI